MSPTAKPVTTLASVVPVESCSVAGPAPKPSVPVPAEAAPERSSVPARIDVPPLNPLAPDSTTVPPPATRLPAPLIGPDSVRVPAGLVASTVSVPLPSATALAIVPAPSRTEAAPFAKLIAPRPAAPPAATSSVPPFSVVPPV